MERRKKLDFIQKLCYVGISSILLALLLMNTPLAPVVDDAESTMWINGYKIETVSKDNWKKNLTVLGYTYSSSDNDIYIRSDLSESNTQKACVHEQLHNLFPDYVEFDTEHDIIYEIDEEFNTELCQKYMERRFGHDGFTKKKSSWNMRLLDFFENLFSRWL